MKKGKKKGLFSKILQVGGKLVKGVIGKTPLGGLVNVQLVWSEAILRGQLGDLLRALCRA